MSARPGTRDAAVFVDKDGTLVEDVPFNADPARMRLVRGGGPAMASLSRAGFQIVIVSNQPGVALGAFEELALVTVERRLRELLAPFGLVPAACYWCPHAPPGVGAGCSCRKPAPGLLLRAAEDLRLDLDRSWMVGDILDDVEAGRAAGCRTVLVDAGNETEWELTPERIPDHTVSDLGTAAERILASSTVPRAAEVGA